jgi:hypothetical protein
LENGYTQGKKPYLPAVEGIKTLMIDYKAPGVTAPAGNKEEELQPGSCLF